MPKRSIVDALLKPRFSILTVILTLLFLAILAFSNEAPTNGWPKLFVEPAADPVALPVLVNEVLAHTDPPQKDTVELYNPNSQAVDISGWYLTDAFDKPKKFKIPANSIIPPGGYLLFDPDSFPIDTRFVYSAEGEEVYLFAADAAGRLTGYHHGFSFGASTNGVSFGRHVTSTGQEEFTVQSALTLGAANAGPNVGPVVFSEILYQPLNGEEYIQLTNITTETVTLYDPNVPSNTWRILGIGDYPLPPNLSLAPGATLLLVADDPLIFRITARIADEVQIVGPYPQELPASGTRLILQMPDPPNQDGLVPYVDVDLVEYAPTAPWPAAAAEQGATLRRVDLGAYGNDPANWTTDKVVAAG